VGDLEALFGALWEGYRAVAPQAERVHALLEARGETFSNDHVAFRTFPIEGIDLEALARPFLERGYVETGSYRFEQKRLVARSYSLAGQPRVFISELRAGEFSPGLQDRIRDVVRDRPARAGDALLIETPTWAPPRFEVYEALAAESEYAAWVAAHGIRANHFTVAFNDLKTFDELADLNAFLVESGFALNGGDANIQGGPAVRLEQSSTVAPPVPVAFADGVREVPGAYYEFARRYGGFDGFVAGSADKIFESTNARG
jgi:hypothetical protein